MVLTLISDISETLLNIGEIGFLEPVLIQVLLLRNLKICMFYYNSYDREVILCEDLQKIKKLDNFYIDIII